MRAGTRVESRGVFAGCGDRLEPGVVARIDSTSISVAEMRDFVVQMPQSLRLQGQGDPARKRYLRSLLGKYLLLLEAKERGLDTAEVVQTKVMQYWRQHLVDTYRQIALGPNVQVSEEEVRAYFADSGLDRKRQMAGILVENDSTAQQIYERLAAGGDFARLAAEYTIDERSAAQGAYWDLSIWSRPAGCRFQTSCFAVCRVDSYPQFCPWVHATKSCVSSRTSPCH